MYIYNTYTHICTYIHYTHTQTHIRAHVHIYMYIYTYIYIYTYVHTDRDAQHCDFTSLYIPSALEQNVALQDCCNVNNYCSSAPNRDKHNKVQALCLRDRLTLVHWFYVQFCDLRYMLSVC